MKRRFPRILIGFASGNLVNHEFRRYQLVAGAFAQQLLSEGRVGRQNGQIAAFVIENQPAATRRVEVEDEFAVQIRLDQRAGVDRVVFGEIWRLPGYP